MEVKPRGHAQFPFRAARALWIDDIILLLCDNHSLSLALGGSHLT